jgi:hypothetical protein
VTNNQDQTIGGPGLARLSKNACGGLVGGRHQAR